MAELVSLPSHAKVAIEHLWQPSGAGVSLYRHGQPYGPMIAKEWEGEFLEFVREKSPRLLEFALLLSGDRGEAEDILQTTLIRVARRWSAAREHPDLFARRVAVNLARDRFRRRSHLAETSYEEWMGGSSSREEAQRKVENDHLLQMVRRLPKRQRAVLVLRFWEDMSVKQTATVLDCSVGTVKSYTHRALDQLRAFLASDDDRQGAEARGAQVTLRGANGGDAPCQPM